MSENEMRSALSLAAGIGQSMAKYGAEINRVEETIIRICKSFGYERVEVFCIASMISVTAGNASGDDMVSQIRRVYAYSADFQRLDDLNALSRDLCDGRIGVGEAKERFEYIIKSRKRFRLGVLFGSVIAAAAFALFFGGDAKDGLCAGMIAVPIYFMNTFISQGRINRLFYTALNSALAGAAAIVFTHFGLASNAPMVMIGDIMLLIPGLMLVNSFRELLCGDIISGLTRLVDSVIVAIAIACGFAIPILAFNYIGW